MNVWVWVREREKESQPFISLRINMPLTGEREERAVEMAPWIVSSVDNTSRFLCESRRVSVCVCVCERECM